MTSPLAGGRSHVVGAVPRWRRGPGAAALRGNLALTGTAWLVDLVIWGGDRSLRGGGLAPAWLVPVVSVIAFAVLLARYRAPVGVFVVHLCYATAAPWVMPGYNPFAGLLLALYAVARHRSALVSAPALLASAVPSAVATYKTVRQSGGSVGIGLATLGTLTVLPLLAAWAFGLRAGRVAAREIQLEAERDVAATVAVRAERLRIARELHDIVAHAVSVMVLQAAGGRAVLRNDPGRAAEALDVVQEVGTQAMTELRRLLGVLRSAAGEVGADAPPERPPGLAELDALVGQMRAAGLAVEVAVEGTPVPVDPVLGLTVHRLVQEALTNTMKHAGIGASARVEIAWDEHDVAVAVTDQAPHRPVAVDGVARLSSGYGLLGLRERIRLVGGVFEAHAVAGGFLVRAVLPLRWPPTDAGWPE